MYINLKYRKKYVRGFTLGHEILLLESNPKANIINFRGFAVNYRTQLPLEEFTGKLSDIYKLYVLKSP
jgi:hypothetical protein